jgi:acyl carrier protein
MTVEEKIRNIVCNAINEDADKLDAKASLVEEYHIDSMMALGIMVALEKEFSIYIPEEDIAEFDTLEDIIELTIEHCNKPKPTVTT